MWHVRISLVSQFGNPVHLLKWHFGGMQLANELNRARFLAKGELIAYSADGEMESPSYFKGARSQDFTRPLQQWEIEHFGFKEFCRFVLQRI